MNKTTLILLTLTACLLFLPLVYAVSPPTDFLHAYTFDSSNALDSNNTANLGCTNTPTYNSGKFGQSINFSSSNSNKYCDNRTVSFLSKAQLTSAWGVSYWVKSYQGAAVSTPMYLVTGAGTSINADFGLTATNNYFGMTFYDGAGKTSTTTSKPTNAGWTNLIVTYDGSNIRTYVNGTLVKTDALTFGAGATLCGAWSSIGSQKYCTTSNTQFFSGELDEIYVYSRALSGSDITNLANATASWNVTTASNVTITATDVYTSASLTNFSATIGGVNYSTTNGTITTAILQNATSLYDINLSSTENGGYFNKTLTSQNVSSNVATTMAQSIITFNVTEILTSKPITNYNVTTSYLTNQTHYMRAGTYNYTTNFSSLYYNISTINLTIPALSIWTINVTAWSRNITFKDNISQVDIYPACTQTLSYINTTWIYNNSADYSQMPSETNSLTCSLFGYRETTITNATRPDNSSYRIQPATLTLTFTSNTYGYIQTLTNITFFNNTNAIYTTQNNLSTGYVSVIFNPTLINESNSSGYQQVFKYYNDQNTTISDTLLLETINLVKTFKVTANTAPVDNARVCTQLPYSIPGSTTWTSTQCDYTDSSGTVLINVHDQQQYKVCVQASGYTTKCFIVYINPADQTTTLLPITSSQTGSGFNYIYSNCPSIFNETESCTLTVNTHTPNYAICIDLYTNRTLSSTTCSSDSISEVFNYNLLPNSNYSVVTRLDNVIQANISHTYYVWSFDVNKTISFDSFKNQSNVSLSNMIDPQNSNYNPLYYTFAHVIALIMILIVSYGFDKKINGYGALAFGLGSLIMAIAGLYAFYIPAVIIGIFYIATKIVPLISK